MFVEITVAGAAFFSPAMDSPVIPRPASTLIPLRDGARGVEVFMLRRSEQATFAPGAYVFPGGRIDDADGASAEVCSGTDDAAASRDLGLAGSGLPSRGGA